MKEVTNGQTVFFANLWDYIRSVSVELSQWKSPPNKPVRELVHRAIADPSSFPLVPGDTAPQLVAPGADATLTKGYVASVAANDDSSKKFTFPVLVVLSRKTGFSKTIQHNNETNNKKSPVKLTRLTLLDGDLNKMHARMATETTEKGRALRCGDIIRVDQYTELSYRVNNDSPLMPALFILEFTTVGYRQLPDEDKIPDVTLSTAPWTGQNLWQSDQERPKYHIDPRCQDPPKCTEDNRLCRKFGVNFIGRCICDQIPLQDRNLETIAEDCYLITSDFENLKNKNFRIMLYWWYATNVYSLCGKENCGKLPDCLEYAIKKMYSEPEGVSYSQYSDGNKRKN